MRILNKVAWYEYLVWCFGILIIDMAIAHTKYGDSYWHGISTWFDVMILALFICGVGLWVLGIITCDYQVLGKDAKGE
jgi:hypothetical protein